MRTSHSVALWLGLLFLPGLILGQTLGEQHIRQLRQTLPTGFVATDLSGLEISDEYQTRHNGVTHVYLKQRFRGLKVESGFYNANFDRHGQFINAHNQLEAHLEKRVPSSLPRINALEAVRLAAVDLGLNPPAQFEVLQASDDLEQNTLLAGGDLSVEDIPVKLTIQSDQAGDLHVAWYLRIYLPKRDHWWNYWVDAETGEVLTRQDWVHTCSWGEHRHPFEHREHHHEGGACSHGIRDIKSPRDGSSYRVLAQPIESPNHGGFQLVSEPADSMASPFGWHDIDGQLGAEFTITRGNNVFALEDLDGTNDPGGYSPDGGSSLSFDFPFDPNGSPNDNRDAAVVNLFYWNNVVHDVFYHLGFDEAAGNFQQNNYGRGGTGGDYVIADARDGSGFNNANFSTPPDGFTPRMQMFIWNPVFVPGLTVNSPSSIAGDYQAPGARFGPGLPELPLTEDLVIMQSSSSTDGCAAADNPAAITGKIAVVDRGGCSFVDKVRNAQNAGAVAVIVINNIGTAPFPMSGNDNGNITIPSAMISQADGSVIRNALSVGPVEVSLVKTDLAGGEDSDFDNGVIVHEYGHGISNRLTGGPNEFGGLSNEEQAGEGWSDWFGLVLTHRNGDTRNTARGMATFLEEQAPSGSGIRPARYSPDFAVNDLTYDDIKSLTVPHGVGSVMATMLWDLYWDLIDEYGFDPNLRDRTAGNVMAIQLVMDGLKLQPAQPGFADVRDAILLADQINSNGANQCLIWKAFARRGLGYSADQGSSGDRGDGTEAFDLPPLCQSILYIANETDAVRVTRGDTVKYLIQWSNRTGSLEDDLSIQGDVPQELFTETGLGDCNPSLTGASRVTIDPGPLEDLSRDTCMLTTTVRNIAQLSVYDQVDSLEGNVATYIPLSLVGSNGWEISTIRPRSGSRHFFVPNVGAINQQVLELPPYRVGPKTVFAFWHQYATEGGWDGGFVEFLPEGSTEWEDLGPYFVINGYNSGVGSNNPAGARPAFSGNSRGYLESWADLSEFEGQNLSLRFQFVSDDNTSLRGWDVDDFAFIDAEKFETTLCLRDPNGILTCGTQSKPTYLAVDSQGVTDLDELEEEFELTVFPNPTQGRLQVQLAQLEAAPVQLTLFNALGQPVLQPASRQAQRAEWDLDLEGLATGVYVLRVEVGSRLLTRRVILR